MERHFLKNIILSISEKDDQSSFRKFFDHYYPRLFDFARLFVKSDHYAEEVVADAFVKVWKSRHKLIQIENIQAYLYTIVKRESLNYIRNFKLNQKLTISFDVEMDFKFTLRTPESDLICNELLMSLNKAINELPDKCRIVFQMVKEDGLKYREVAQVLNISEKAVEKHISSALKKIRYEINKQFFADNLKKLVLSSLIFFFTFIHSIL